MVIYCFDTSAINDLFDDPDREPIVTAILATASFRVTAYNVLEIAKTKDEGRRKALMEMTKKLADNKRPLDRPNTILLNYATAHASGSSSALVNADSNLEGIWIALNQPELIDHPARSEALSWAKKWEGGFFGSCRVGS